MKNEVDELTIVVTSCANCVLGVNVGDTCFENKARLVPRPTVSKGDLL
jgi:hypothetical protein